MGKQKKGISNMSGEENIAEIKIEREPEMNLETFAGHEGLKWSIKVRLAYHIETKNLPRERTADEWRAILKAL
ncbi:MAG: hypothetical protein P4L45_00735 [Ignavibacteriaceae bacterium]|nr:hypothetical protein [Ignavibacteriaceae bacterium]